MSKRWQKLQNWMTDLLPLLPKLSFLKSSQADWLTKENLNTRDIFQIALIYLFMEKHPLWIAAEKVLKKLAKKTDWRTVASFLFFVKDELKQEIESSTVEIPANSQMLSGNDDQLFLQTWKTFFPEGVEIATSLKKTRHDLLHRRMVKIQQKNQQPIDNPARQILFTSNVLLRPPLEVNEKLSPKILQVVKANQSEPQKYWYDHPIPLDAPAQNNEILYGLDGLDQMMAFEKRRGNVEAGQKLNCLLSCSVTYTYLHQVARDYVSQLIAEKGSFDHLNIFLFTETDCKEIVNTILKPAAKHYFAVENADFSVFGVDGEYGRHYTFLKAIAAFWQVLIDPQVKGTFKIDLDQVFPQEMLVKETGSSALELFKTELWGAEGEDFRNQRVRLDLIAGALVNASDIKKGLFTPDVPYPHQPETPEEFIFFSKLPQALSTEVEMMNKYNWPPLDGKSNCLQRIHVTGGTNGILIRALFDYQPFTPSFIGRAEDQAFILSFFNQKVPLLRYVHRPGLIMRHDKELFAQQAIKVAETGKIIGDYVRMIYFSAYARWLDPQLKNIKQELDPFTGSFISQIPTTVVMLRFLLKGLEMTQNNQAAQQEEFLQTGVRRIEAALNFTQGKPSHLEKQIVQEKKAWSIYYQVLKKLQQKIKAKDPFALELKASAVSLVDKTKL